MAKNVTYKRAGKIIYDGKEYRHADPMVISDEFYEKHEDWFQVIEDVPDKDLEDLTVEQLKDLLREKDLKVSGSKDELIERLRS